ncbi:MAG: disulfide bond formation protein DsbB, partial [Candidatus Azotimanducaceae bacterium]
MLQMIPSSRAIYALVFLGCVGLLGVALYMEHVMSLDPCPLCIFQRVMVLATGIVALLAALHGPQQLGVKIYGGLMILTATIGGAISTRQLWLQSLPEDQV